MHLSLNAVACAMRTKIAAYREDVRTAHATPEGFDTKDLQEARALLAALRHWVIEPLVSAIA